MKQYTLLLFFLIGMGIHVQAQNVRLDIEAGPNFSTLSAPTGNDFESNIKLGNHIGVEAGIALSGKIEFYGGISLSEVQFDRIYSTSSLEGSNEFPEELELSYSFKTIGIPFGVRYIHFGGLFDVGIFAGLQPIFTSGHDGERISNEVDIQQQFDLSEEIQDVGLFVEPGLKISYALDEDTKIFTGFKYGFDMLGIYESGDDNRRLHRFDLNVGLSIALF